MRPLKARSFYQTVLGRMGASFFRNITQVHKTRGTTLNKTGRRQRARGSLRYVSMYGAWPSLLTKRKVEWECLHIFAKETADPARLHPDNSVPE